MNILIIGNIASGKSTLAEELSKALSCEIFSIDDMRKEYSDGTFAGEFMAWSKMLEVIQHPEPSGAGVYEFSGTGKNTWFVREAMKYSQEHHKAKWLTVYCLCDKPTLLKRLENRTYNIPIPYNFGNPEASVAWMSNELQKTYGSDYWNSPEVTVRTDKLNPKDCAKAILKKIK